MQLLPSNRDRVTVVARLAELRSTNGWFAPADVDRLFEQLRVPVPTNTSQILGRLRDSRLAVRRSSGAGWSLSATGREKAAELIGDVDPDRVAPELGVASGAEFGHVLHTVIPPELVPVQWSAETGTFLEEYPFERNVFLMTRFPRSEDDGDLDPVEGVVPIVRDTLAAHGLTLHLASDRNIVDDLLGNVAAHIWVCKYGIGLLEDRLGRGLNYNMMTELGAMLVMGRRCALLKDVSFPDQLPTDITGQIYKSVDFDDLSRVRDVVDAWASEDLRL